MEVKVCIGSSCHLKGSKDVVEGLKKMVEQNNLSDRVQVCGAFCMGQCKTGVSVSVDGEYFSVSPDTCAEFFENEIKAKA